MGGPRSHQTRCLLAQCGKCGWKLSTLASGQTLQVYKVKRCEGFLFFGIRCDELQAELYQRMIIMQEKSRKSRKRAHASLKTATKAPPTHARARPCTLPAPLPPHFPQRPSNSFRMSRCVLRWVAAGPLLVRISPLLTTSVHVYQAAQIKFQGNTPDLSLASDRAITDEWVCASSPIPAPPSPPPAPWEMAAIDMGHVGLTKRLVYTHGTGLGWV
jgi:hypothetical protein